MSIWQNVRRYPLVRAAGTVIIEVIKEKSPLPLTVKTTRYTGYVKLWKWENFNSSLHDRKRMQEDSGFGKSYSMHGCSIEAKGSK